MENNSRERKRKGRKKTGQRKRKLGRTLLVIGAAAMLLIAAVLACQKYLYHDLIYHNIYIDDLSIGGLTREQAVQQLNSAWQDRKNQIEIHLVYRDQEWFFIMRIFNRLQITNS